MIITWFIWWFNIVTLLLLLLVFQQLIGVPMLKNVSGMAVFVLIKNIVTG